MVRVAVLDGSGNRVTSARDQVSLELVHTSPITLQGPTTVGAALGLASFSGLRIDRAATGFRLRATAPGLTSILSAPFSIVAADASGLAFVRQPSASERGEWMEPVEVAAVDPFGNLAAQGGSVSLAVDPSSGSLQGYTYKALVSGLARFDAIRVERIGTYVLKAGLGGWSTASEPFTVTDTVPPTVVRSNPSPGASGALPQTSIVVYLSEPVDPSSVHVETFSVEHEGEPVLGALGVAGRTITFEPAQLLELGARYDVRLTWGITDEAGNGLLEPYQFSFWTRAPSWVLRTLDTASRRPRSLSLATGGSAVASWLLDNGFGYREGRFWDSGVPGRTLEARNIAGAIAAGSGDGGTVLALFLAALVEGSRYPGLWWQRCLPDAERCESAQLLDGEPGRIITDPRIVVRPSGEAFAVWKTWPDSGEQTRASELRFSRYRPGIGWAEPGVLAGERNDPSEIGLVTDALGHAMVAWAERAEGRSWARRFSEAGWGPLAPICSSEQINAARLTDLAGADDGSAVAACIGSDARWRPVVIASRFTPGSGWEAAALLDSGTGGAPVEPRVAASEAGGAVVIWGTNRGALRSRAFDPNAGWLPEGGLVQEGSPVPTRWDVSMDGVGSAMAVWWALPGAGSLAAPVYGSRASGDAAWSSPVRLYEAGGEMEDLKIEHLANDRPVIAFSHGVELSTWWVRVLTLE